MEIDAGPASADLPTWVRHTISADFAMTTPFSSSSSLKSMYSGSTVPCCVDAGGPRRLIAHRQAPLSVCDISTYMVSQMWPSGSSKLRPYMKP
jgi:hypothetical protein